MIQIIQIVAALCFILVAIGMALGISDARRLSVGQRLLFGIVALGAAALNLYFAL